MYSGKDLKLVTAQGRAVYKTKMTLVNNSYKPKIFVFLYTGKLSYIK